MVDMAAVMKLEEMINKVHCANCLEFMRDMPDGCVDLIVTDPPYPETAHFETDKEYLRVCFQECFRILRDDSFLVMDYRRQNLVDYINLLSSFSYFDMIIAFRSNSMANCSMGFDKFIPSLVMAKGNAKVRNRRYNAISSARTVEALEGWHGHPTQKPLNYYCLKVHLFSNNNDIIFDPFVGSGTTAIACKELGRNFIGIEINPDYCKIAENRLKQEILPLVVER